MKARKILFKVVKSEEADFTYRQMLCNILKTPKNGQRADAEEMDLVLPILSTIRKAPEDAKEVVLSEEAWKELNSRVQAFKPNIIAQELRDFMKDIAASEAIELDETPVAK